MKTISEVRKAFWEAHPEFKNSYRKSYRQNQYNTDINVAFVDYVDYLLKSGDITQNLANKITL